MKIAVLIIRILLGLGFTVFGANILHPFLPMPPQDPQALITQFSMIMMNSHWMMLVGACQLIGGLLLLSGKFVPLGLTILSAVLVNILACHIFLDGGNGIAPGLVFSVFDLFLIWAYRDHFAGLFSANAKPSV